MLITSGTIITSRTLITKRTSITPPYYRTHKNGEKTNVNNDIEFDGLDLFMVAMEGLW